MALTQCGKQPYHEERGGLHLGIQNYLAHSEQGNTYSVLALWSNIGLTETSCAQSLPNSP